MPNKRRPPLPRSPSLKHSTADKRDQLVEDAVLHPDKALIVPFELVEGLFTRERVRMLKLLRERGPFRSIQGLAAALGRDYTHVTRDVSALVGVGLVQVERPEGDRRGRGFRAVVSAPVAALYLR